MTSVFTEGISFFCQKINLWRIKMNELKETVRNWKECLLYGLLALILGAVIGVIDAIFGKGLLAISELRTAHLSWFLPFLALAGILIVWVYEKFGKESSRGMGLVFAVGHGEEEKIPFRLVPLVLVSTWITHLFGGSAGREGVAVQIGATVSQCAARYIAPSASRIFLVAGVAAGFSGIFRTPIAAVLFAVEVLCCGKIDYKAMFPSLVAALTASKVSALLGLPKFTVAIKNEFSLNAKIVIKLLILGFIFGLTGKLFAGLLSFMKKVFAARIKNPYTRICIVGISLTIVLFLFHFGRYCGLGTNLISDSFTGGKIYSYDWILKLLLTIITLAAGYQGGEVTPLFSIGASLGAVIASFFGLPVELVAALGYASVFGSATNTYFAPILIGAEVFGFSNLPLFFIVHTAAHCLGSHTSIYSAQKVLS